MLEPRRLLTRVAVIGDFSSNTQVAPTQDVANLVASWSPEAVVTAGDNNYPSGAASTIDSNIGQWYHSFIHPYGGTFGAGSADNQNHFWPAIGNHDWNPSAGYNPYLNYFTLPNNERYYTVQIGDIAVFVINSDTHEPDGVTATSVQGNWIHQQMIASSAPWKIVVIHHPPYSSGSIGSNPASQWPFKDWGATAVIAGHDHLYERLSVGGLTYFVNGLGGESIAGFDSPVAGSQVRYDDNYGAMQIDSAATSITFRFITRSGEVIDTYTIDPNAIVQTLIGAGATWKYLDNGTNQGTLWRGLGFDDSTWAAGAAELGYGDGDEATVVSFGPNPNSKYITTYFRKSFTVTNPGAISGLSLGIKRDDGAVVYLNGSEIYRTNMPGGAFNYTTRASESIEDEAFYFQDFSAALNTGNNVIAVEIHQGSSSSSDISFDFELTALTHTAWMTGGALNVQFDGSATPIALSTSGSNVVVTRGNLSSQSFAGVSSINVTGTSAADILQITAPLAPPVTFDSGAGNDSLDLLTGSYTFTTPLAGNIALTIAAAASATFDVSQHLRDLNVLGLLDVRDNNIVIDNPAALGSWSGTQYTAVTGMIQDGRLTTSLTDVGDFTTRRLGIATAGEVVGISGTETDTWNGIAVSPGSVIVKYTYAGDLNLDGRIDGDDYFNLDSHVLQTGAVFGYFVGDANLDGELNGDDYFWIDSQILSQGSPL